MKFPSAAIKPHVFWAFGGTAEQGGKSLKRATFVGETKGGGAHPVRERRVDDHFEAAIPFERKELSFILRKQI